jgi:putative addiction module component (TIGR02574 family)
MSRALSLIEDEIRSLGTADKERLLQLIWEELDGPADTQADSEWLREVARRSAEIDSGAVSTIPATAVFDRVLAKLEK